MLIFAFINPGCGGYPVRKLTAAGVPLYKETCLWPRVGSPDRFYWRPFLLLAVKIRDSAPPVRGETTLAWEDRGKLKNGKPR
jgi:hypothetical protein